MEWWHLDFLIGEQKEEWVPKHKEHCSKLWLGWMKWWLGVGWTVINSNQTSIRRNRSSNRSSSRSSGFFNKSIQIFPGNLTLICHPLRVLLRNLPILLESRFRNYKKRTCMTLLHKLYHIIQRIWLWEHRRILQRYPYVMDHFLGQFNRRTYDFSNNPHILKTF